ncbi:MerR family transcriptional regulator [Companilactobacillus mishanensis]|uniref:MerR family transcriptional regulator n=1 Tax=Companilactobacillus mishanensis TaxID=2486008 RepID=UPI001296A013|nr:MerR family transcriptional regulator [Companilactobacillus mishanensis]MQS88901.1 MerR family transcriptional regulator [Companilactobacillus mishanensis]
MLKISEMAKLASTTRRTLIYYDEQGLFSPAEKTDASYRYYEYNQLYDLMFILGLRKLGMSVEEIREIKNSQETTSDKLLGAQERVSTKIHELEHIQTVIDQRLEQKPVDKNVALYQPMIKKNFDKFFWCSRQTVSCTEEEIAELFAEFYKQLDSLAVMDTGDSGFLTDLPVTNPTGYADAGFRILKETIVDSKQVFIPVMKKDGGNYISIYVENTGEGIVHGLKMLNSYCIENHIQTDNHLWQMDYGNDHNKVGAAKIGKLEYSIVGGLNLKS